MGLGREIVREQQFFRKELKERVRWFVGLRWLAVAGGGLAVAVAWGVGLALPHGPILATLAVIALYNLLCVGAVRRLEGLPPAVTRPILVFAHAQITLDLLALCLLIHLTGGPASPLTVFVLFHVILAGILLSPASCYTYAALVAAALAVVLLLHQSGHAPAGAVALAAGSGGRGAWLTFGFLAAGLGITAYLVTSLKVALQLKGRELMKLSRELELGNTKLTSLYGMIKEVGSCPSFQGLLDAATQSGARIMGVKACSIKLWDPTRDCLRFASTYGLSEDYLAKDCVSVQKSAVNRKIIEGSLYSIGHIEEEGYFQYPEDIRAEKIASMMCLPLKAAGRTLGVYCVYSDQPHHFKEGDAAFFTLMTDLTAMAMERLEREMGKTWFLNKAAHQLRAPLNAILSMLTLIADGYQGPVDPRQAQTLERCEKRLNALSGVINDLLKLTAQRQAPPDQVELTLVDAGKVLGAVAPVFKAQAEQRGITFIMAVMAEPLGVRGREEWLDEVFSNLLSNAVKYTPSGGTVTVRLGREDDGRLLFEVSDSGIGIPPEDQNRLFSEFFRAENARDWAEEGTGIGLVIVKEALDRMGGRIALTSRPGQGTRVRCLLPLAPPLEGT